MATLSDQTVYDDEGEFEETERVSVERPVLILLEGNGVNRRQPVDKPTMTMGRDTANEIVLRDTRCSRRHARLDYLNYTQSGEPPQIHLHDLGSTNGTYVNGTRVQTHTLHDRDKIMIGSTIFGFFLRDEAEIAADQQLFQMASKDALTGLSNRGVFNMELEKEFDRVRRYNRSLSLVIFDIDHFKRFNDTYGHQMGDTVLREIGRLTKGNIRFNDMAARYGGEEFTIILPETAIDGALIQAERMRQAVQQCRIPNGSTTISITISVGVAQVQAGMTSTEDLIRGADRALYHAKAEGRNRVCWLNGDRLNSGLGTEILPRQTA